MLGIYVKKGDRFRSPGSLGLLVLLHIYQAIKMRKAGLYSELNVIYPPKTSPCSVHELGASVFKTFL